MRTSFGVIFFSGIVSNRRVNSVGIEGARRIAYSLADDRGVAVPVQGVWRGDREDAWLVAIHELQGEQLREMAAGLARMFEQEAVIFGELEAGPTYPELHHTLTREEFVNKLDTVETWTMVDGKGKTITTATASDWLTYEQVETAGLEGWTDIDGEAFVIKFKF